MAKQMGRISEEAITELQTRDNSNLITMAVVELWRKWSDVRFSGKSNGQGLLM